MSIHPTVSEAKQLSKKYNLQRCIVFFQLPDGRCGHSSYGKTKALCDHTRDVADGMWEAFEEEATQ